MHDEGVGGGMPVLTTRGGAWSRAVIGDGGQELGAGEITAETMGEQYHGRTDDTGESTTGEDNLRFQSSRQFGRAGAGRATFLARTRTAADKHGQLACTERKAERQRSGHNRPALQIITRTSPLRSRAGRGCPHGQKLYSVIHILRQRQAAAPSSPYSTAATRVADARHLAH